MDRTSAIKKALLMQLLSLVTESDLAAHRPKDDEKDEDPKEEAAESVEEEAKEEAQEHEPGSKGDRLAKLKKLAAPAKE